MTTKASNTQIKPCRCKHVYQDKTYGANQRVHNYMKGGKRGLAGWRCTVCGDQKRD